MRPKVILFSTLLLLASCKGVRDGDYSRDVFRYNESMGIPTLDPAFAINLQVIWPANQLFNGLVELNDSLRVKPAIARSWKISDDGLTYIFDLRTDVFFHDSDVFPNGEGRQVVAQDFVYSISRVIDPQVASPGAWAFSLLDKERVGTQNGCVAINDSTLAIHIREPFPPFLGILTMPYAFVVPKEAVEFFGRDFRSNPVGTGPFRFMSWREGERLVLRRNPNYFEVDYQGVKLPYLEAISISFTADKQSEFLEFLLGNIDYISGIHASSRDELLTRRGTLRPKYQGRIKMLTGPYLNTEYLAFLVDTSMENLTGHPLQDVRVRRAIGYGFDRERMMLYLRSNMGYPAHGGFVPPGMPGFSNGVKGYSYNPQLARELLAQAGYPNGVGIQPITLATTEAYVDICEFIQHQLAEIGIPIRVEVLPGVAYRDMMANSRLMFFRASWVADYADAENYLSLFHSHNFSPGGPNYTHFAHSKFDRLYAEALTITDDYQRQVIYRKMDSLVMANAPVLPMYYDKVARFVQPNVHGMEPNPMNLLVLKRVWKE